MGGREETIVLPKQRICIAINYPRLMELWSSSKTVKIIEPSRIRQPWRVCKTTPCFPQKTQEVAFWPTAKSSTVSPTYTTEIDPEYRESSYKPIRKIKQFGREVVKRIKQMFHKRCPNSSNIWKETCWLPEKWKWKTTSEKVVLIPGQVGQLGPD